MHAHTHTYAHWRPAWGSMAWVTALENRYRDAQGCSEGKWINAVSFAGTLFSFTLSQGFGCVSVSGVRAGYYLIVMKEKRCRWEQQRWWQKISPLGKMLQKQRHIVSSTENHVLLWALLGLGVSDGHRKQRGCCHGDGWWPEISFFSTSSLIFNIHSQFICVHETRVYDLVCLSLEQMFSQCIFWMIKPFAPWIENYTIFFGLCIWCIDHSWNNTGLLRILNDLAPTRKNLLHSSTTLCLIQ